MPNIFHIRGDGVILDGFVSTTTNQQYPHILTFNTASGEIGYYTGSSYGGGTTITLTNGVDNKVITATGASGLQGENNLTFDGNTLNVIGNVTATSITASFSGSLTGALTGTASWATNVSSASITDNTGSNATFYPVFVANTGSNQYLQTDSSTLTYNPSTNTLTVAQLAGNATTAITATTGNSSSITNNTNTAATYYPTFVANTGSNQYLQTDSTTLTYNPNTNTLTVAQLAGNASTATTATNANNVAVTDNPSASGPLYIAFVPNTGSNQAIQTDSNGLIYNPSNNSLTASAFSGSFTGTITGNASTATTATNVAVTDNTNTNLTYYPTFVANTGSNQPIQTDSSILTYNPSTNTLTVAQLAGNATTATNVAVTDNTSGAGPVYIAFVPNTGSNQAIQTDSNGLIYNPSNNSLSASAFSGSFTGTVSGNASTATNATNVAVTNTNTDATYYPTFVANTGSNQPIQTDSSTLTYNPNTNTLTVAQLAGNATTATTANSSSITNNTGGAGPVYITFVANTGSNQYLQTDSNGLIYNPSNNSLSASAFSGSLTGTATNVQGGTTGYMTLWQSGTQLTSSTSLYESGSDYLAINTTTAIRDSHLTIQGVSTAIKGFLYLPSQSLTPYVNPNSGSFVINGVTFTTTASGAPVTNNTSSLIIFVPQGASATDTINLITASINFSSSVAPYSGSGNIYSMSAALSGTAPIGLYLEVNNPYRNPLDSYFYTSSFKQFMNQGAPVIRLVGPGSLMNSGYGKIIFSSTSQPANENSYASIESDGGNAGLDQARLIFRTSYGSDNQERMIITQRGNIGINRPTGTAISAKLHVDADIYSSQIALIASGTTAAIQSTGPVKFQSITNTSQTNLLMYNTTDGNVTYQPTTAVTVGTSTNSTTATNASNVIPADASNTTGNYYLTFITNASTTPSQIQTDNALRYNPATNQIASASLLTGTGSTSVPPIRMAGGSLLSSSLVGAIEFDNTASYITTNTTSGRGEISNYYVYRLTTNGATIGVGSDYFGSNSSINLEAGSIYDIESVTYFRKDTVGTIQLAWSASSAPFIFQGNIQRSPDGGINPGSILTGTSTNDSAAGINNGSLIFATTPSLPNGGFYVYRHNLFLVTNTAANLRLRLVAAGGSITPFSGSYYMVRKIATNTGNFVA